LIPNSRDVEAMELELTNDGGFENAWVEAMKEVI
jgi:hypothetical protein